MRPGIHTMPDDFLKSARTDPALAPLVKLAPRLKVKRKGVRLALRRLCYAILART